MKAHGPTYWTENDEGHSVLTDIRWEAGYYTQSTPAEFTVDVEDDKGTVTTLKVLFTVNHAPTIELTSPADGAEFVSPAIVTLAATASDNTADGVLRQVQFFVNGEPVGTATKAPFETDWPVTNPIEY